MFRGSLATMILRLTLLLLTTSAANATATPPDAALRDYVLGRHASADAKTDAAERYFASALAADPRHPALTRRAFDIAIAAGDQARAVALARQLTTDAIAYSDVALVLLADGVLRKDWPAVAKARAGIASAGYAAVIEPIVSAWALFAQGDHEQALLRLDPGTFTGFARSYVVEQRAHMLAADGQYGAAAAAYADLSAGGGAGYALVRLGEADAVAQGGDRAAALALLESDDSNIVAARARLLAGKRIGALAPDARRGLGWAMARLATDLSRQEPSQAPNDLALVFARIATFLSPDVAATWLVMSDVLVGNDRNEAALAALANVRRDDPLYPAADARRAEALEAVGRSADSGLLLKATARARGAQSDDWARLGDWYRRADRFAEAIAAYDQAITVANAAGGARWSLFFLRGTMHERAGDWPAAETDLRAALARSPDEPVVLNYLGYSMLDRGVEGGEPAALIVRAAKLRPGDGGIIDSLGWSQFQNGAFDDAVKTLERAAALEPIDPTVTDHLGDAYWQTGRRIEARFRWRAALALDPDPKLQAVLTSKLAVGRDAALALAVTAQPVPNTPPQFAPQISPQSSTQP
jgi:tetratricopeptide (TPR) repeat protein